MMEMVTRLLGRGLLWSDGLLLLAEMERELLAEVPPNHVVVPLLTDIPGATAVNLASGCRVTVQYDIHYNDLATRMSIQYQPATVTA